MDRGTNTDIDTGRLISDMTDSGRRMHKTGQGWGPSSPFPLIWASKVWAIIEASKPTPPCPKCVLCPKVTCSYQLLGVLNDLFKWLSLARNEFHNLFQHCFQKFTEDSQKPMVHLCDDKVPNRRETKSLTYKPFLKPPV